MFWSPNVKVGDIAAFQVSLAAPTLTSISSLPFSSLAIYPEEDGGAPILIRHAPEKDKSAVQWVNIGNVTSQESVEVEANLGWDAGNILIISGTMSSNVPTVLKVRHQHAFSEWVFMRDHRFLNWSSPWNWMLGRSNFLYNRVLATRDHLPLGNGYHLEILRALLMLDASSMPLPCMMSFIPSLDSSNSGPSVKHRQHQVSVSIQHEAPAYLDENYPITIEVTNFDSKDFDVTLDILLQPTDVDGAGKKHSIPICSEFRLNELLVNKIIFEDEESPSLIKGVHCGIAKSGTSISKTVHLLSGGAAGDRMLDISVQTRIPEDSPFRDEEGHRINDVTEKLQTVVVPTLEAFHVNQEVTYQHNLKEWRGVADLDSYEEDFVDEGRSMEVMVVTDVSVAGPWSIYVEHIELKDGVSQRFNQIWLSC